MTDEEMAEEYTTKNGFGSDCNNLTSYDANKEIEQAYLAGLKAGRPQWHYVKDGDLPKDETEKEYLVALKSEYSGFYYEIDIWCKSLHCFASNNPKKVYAWKEIVPPKEIE